MEDSFGLRNYGLEVAGDGLRDLGAMEGNADKLGANRVNLRDMGWAISGAYRMNRLVNLRRMGQLHGG